MPVPLADETMQALPVMFTPHESTEDGGGTLGGGGNVGVVAGVSAAAALVAQVRKYCDAAVAQVAIDEGDLVPLTRHVSVPGSTLCGSLMTSGRSCSPRL